MRKNIFALCILFLSSFPALSVAEGPTIVGETRSGVDSEPASTASNSVSKTDGIIKKMSLEEKLGQLMMVGIPGPTLDEASLALIKKAKISNFILFSRNIENPKQALELTKRITSEAVKISGLLPLIAVDQEGGNVVRVPTSPKTPSPLSISTSGSKESAYSIGYETGLILSRLGINMNLAPVLDLGSATKRSFIGNRSFGEQPQLVSEFAVAYSKGLIEAGIVPVAKHFPGGGGGRLDPHKQSISRGTSLAELEGKDLIPFKEFISLTEKSGVMMSHVIYPKIDSEKLPSVISKNIINGLLREKLQFKGLVVSDDLMMNLQAQAKPTEKELNQKVDLVVKAIAAGSNLAIMSWSLPQMHLAMKALKTAVNEGRLDIHIVDAAVKSIINMKLSLSVDARKQREIASTSIALSTKKLEASARYVLTKNTEQSDLSSAMPAIRGLRSARELCVLSPDQNFRSSFQKVIPKAVVEEKLEALPADCSLIVLGGNGGYLEGLSTKLSRSQMASMIAVTFTPYNSKINANLLAAIPLFSNFEEAGKTIAERILRIRHANQISAR